MAGDRRVRVALLAAVVLGAALVTRAAPLYWSPHPSTLDGFQYAWFAREALATTRYPLDAFRVDSFGYTGLLAVTGAVVDATPLRTIQPLTTVVGTGGVVLGMVVARRVVGELGWPTRRRALAVLLAGAVLAVDGLYVRRTSVADEEVLTLVMLPCLALALHCWLRERRLAWLGLVGVLSVAMPLTHVLATLVTALTLLALVALHVVRDPSRRTLVGGGVLVGGFWGYFAVYYWTAIERTAMTVPYVERVTAYPGVFLAWTVLLCVAVSWVWVARPRVRRAVVALPLVAVLGVFVANHFVTIYPGTSTTPPGLLVPVLLLGVPAVAAALGSGRLDPTHPAGTLVAATLGAPLALIGFALTASLTPEYFDTVMRSQTFLHPAVAVLAGMGVTAAVARYAAFATNLRSSTEGEHDSGPGSHLATDGAGHTARSTRRWVGVAVVTLLLVATAGSLPLAYVNVDTVTYPSTTLDSEFDAVAFADRADGPLATDHSMSRVSVHYFRRPAAIGPSANFLHGGEPPNCVTLSQESWSTTGAHLFPSAAESVSAERYDRWLATSHVVYANTGRDPVTVSMPSSASSGC